ncbi:MAG TPA: LuxR C-terminal-related transcriptional regulator [Gaiellaceae bacterium]
MHPDDTTWFPREAADPSPETRQPYREESLTETVTLSRRQREVLGLLAEGFPPRAIAAQLGIAETTVRNHIQGVLRRLGCHSQLQAVALARRSRLI